MSIKDHVDMTVPSKRACSVEWVIDLGSSGLAGCDEDIGLNALNWVSFGSLDYGWEEY